MARKHPFNRYLGFDAHGLCEPLDSLVERLQAALVEQGLPASPPITRSGVMRYALEQLFQAYGQGVDLSNLARRLRPNSMIERLQHNRRKFLR